MDTTQKNREEAARRSRKDAPKSAQKRPQGTKKQHPAAQEPTQHRQPRQEAARTEGSQRPRQEAVRTEESQQARNRASSAGQRREAPAKAGQQRGTEEKPRQQPPRQAQSRQAEPRQAAGQKRKAPPKQQPPEQQRKKAPKQSTAPRQKGLSDSVSNKKRAYGNSKPKKKSAFAKAGDMVKAAAQRNAAKEKAKKEAKGKTKRSKRPRQPTPAVIYTQPQAFNRNRFLIQLLTVTAVVVALVLGLSVFFKVGVITVSGADVYTPWTVQEVSGISVGDNLLTFSRARAAALIKANLPYVKNVRFGIKLPDTVNIIIEEEDVVYAIKDTNDQWWLINSDGRVVEQSNRAKASSYTQVLGVTLDNPVSGEKGIASEAVPTETDESGEYVAVTLTGAQRLNAALQILSALEDNDIVGDAASVDVSLLEDIVLWYGTRYQVNLGDSSRIDYKIACASDVILQLSEYDSGILDISFNIWSDRVVYTPFS